MHSILAKRGSKIQCKNMTFILLEFRPKCPANSGAVQVLEKARHALGMVLARRDAEITLRGRIVEVEAYGGRDDPASHAYRRKTPRNAVMFGSGGVAYIYFIYGMHHCLNIVTGNEHEAAAILVRALEPLENISGRTDGPARLCAALNIDRRLNGVASRQRQSLAGTGRLAVASTPDRLYATRRHKSRIRLRPHGRGDFL